jgi:Tfp pilus assembly protein PilX
MMSRYRKSLRQGAVGVAAQRGAALVIGLLLLVVLIILAVGGMRTAAVDLLMTTNTQYRDHAFQAAEYGIEQAMNTTLCTSCTYSSPVTTGSTTPATAIAVPGSSTDKYAYSYYYETTGAAPSGYSLDAGGSGTAYYYAIQSTGTSARSAQDVHDQGFMYIGPSP